MKHREFLKLSLPNNLSYVSIAQMCARELARKIGFSGDDLYKIELAVDEAATNVIQHAFEADENSTFDIIFERIPLGIKINIKEQGMPFDPSQLPKFDPLSLATGQPSKGLGIFLMKEVMDEVSFHNLGPEGKATHLIKYLHNKNIEDYFPSIERESEDGIPQKPPRPANKTAYDVRFMEPGEAIEISKCAYRSHGYTYFDDHIYYPERIVELNNSSLMISAVAVTPENVFMGHAALVFEHPGDTIAEITFAFVNPEYRGAGCLNRLTEFLFEVARQRKLDGIFAYAVANHVYSQKAIHKYGISDCGILLGTSPETWVFKGISQENRERISMVMGFRYIGTPQSLTIYAPPHHKEIIEALYKDLGAEHTYAVPTNPDLHFIGDEAVIETNFLASEGNADIVISSYGANVVRQVKGILHELCLKQAATIELVLNLEDPATSSLASEFEKMGFFFAGILPKTRIGDALILQYLNNVSVDYNAIQVNSDMANRILAYIKRYDPNIRT